MNVIGTFGELGVTNLIRDPRLY